MEHEQIEEVLALDGSGPVFSAFGMAIPEGDHAVPAVQDIFFLDDASVQVAAKIDQCLLTVACVLAVNHPLLGAIMGNRQLVFDQGLEQFSTEDLGQSLVAEEIFPGFFLPQAGLLVDACSGHDHMDVGMIVQGSGMGVEDGGESR